MEQKYVSQVAQLSVGSRLQVADGSAQGFSVFATVVSLAADCTWFVAQYEDSGKACRLSADCIHHFKVVQAS